MKTPRTRGFWRRLGAAGLGCLLLGGTLHAKRAPQVLVVGDLTEAGRKMTPPTSDRPLYYFPLVAGYKELGAIIAGEEEPKKNDVLHALAVALAKENYRVMNTEHEPDVLLVFHWGSMNPEIQDFGLSDPGSQVFFNQREMLALVGAYKVGSMMGWESEDLKSAARDDRYFVIVLAFDYAAARKHEKKLLWVAKMSTESVGTNLPESFPALIASGGPVFGRDTRPTRVDSSKPARTGRVILGPTEVKEYLSPDKK